MAEMKTERKKILDYLSENKFLIPMYQRAYVWREDECEQLYDDIYIYIHFLPTNKVMMKNIF